MSLCSDLTLSESDLICLICRRRQSQSSDNSDLITSTPPGHADIYSYWTMCVSEPPACWGLPASPSSSSAARSWPDRPSCHRQRALSCGQWSCSLGSSTQSAPFRPFSAAIDDHEITAAGRPGSWAESPSPHTLSCSPSWCSLDYYLVSTRCARHASQTCVPGWPKPATIPVALPHTLRAASRLLAFAQDTGRLVNRPTLPARCLVMLPFILSPPPMAKPTVAAAEGTVARRR